MTKNTEKERISRLFDGDLKGANYKDINRDEWELYAIIGDSLRNGPDFLTRDVSSRVFDRIASEKQENKGFFLRLAESPFCNYLRNSFRLPKTSSYQFASVAIVFALGFSANNIVGNFKDGDIENFYVESGVRSVAVLNSSEQIQSDCDISEVFIDELIMHHERLSGSSDLC